MNTNTDKIRALNDNLRQNIIFGGYVCTVLTEMVQALPVEKQIELMVKVQQFDDFNEDNDPHQEHDVGKVSMDGKDYFFKIDYYDNDLKYHSPNPADPTQTIRILTILHTSEY